MSCDYGTEYQSARDRIFTVLRDLGWHTSSELRDVGGVRYGARLLELKRLGYEIAAEDLPGHGRRYRLVSLEPGIPQGKRVKVLLDEADVVDLLHGRVSLTGQAALRDSLASYRANRGKL